MSSYDKQDVPTAAGTWFDPEEEAYKPIGTQQVELRSGEELVRRSDHEERVEQARNEMRREILDKIENRIRKLKQDNQSAKAEAQAKGNALAHDVALELRGSISELEELRDEVSSE